jgi:hypothetical protein
MITETVITTVNENDKIHFSAIGIEFSKTKAVFYLYKKSITALNLKRKGSGVINIVDKAEYLIKSALNSKKIDVSQIKKNELYYLTDCCIYYEFKVLAIKNYEEKHKVEVEILVEKDNRRYIGFNRANNLLLEAAIIASRVGITKNKNDLIKFIDDNRRVIIKTGDKNTKELLKLLERNLEYNNFNNRSDSLDSN